MKQKPEALSYIVAIFKDMNLLRILMPDFNIQLGIPLPKKARTPHSTLPNKMVIDWSDEDALAIGKAVLKAYDMSERHIEEKDWTPKRSAIKDLVKEGEDSLTLPAFTKRVSKYIKVSEDTVKRDLERGWFEAYKTIGGEKGPGHYRIPETQVARYVAILKLKKKSRPNPELDFALKPKDEANL